MSSNIPGLVESSLNLGIFHIEEDKAVFRYSVRSSVESYRNYLENKLNYMTQFLGGEFNSGAKYPAWEYKADSKLREYLTEIYKEQYGQEPKFEAIHAGLECGFFAEKIPDIDIVSFGPEIFDIHTPKERLSIASAVRVYKFIEKAIEGLKAERK
jgi:dipeptidase D